MESFSFIQWALEHLNYWTVMLLMTIESSFIPFPSEIVVPPAAYLAAAGELNVYLVVLSATAGALLGALINYGLSIWIGRAIVYKFVNSRLGHACLLNEQKMIKAENYFVRYGNISTLVGRLVPGIRQLISIPAGLAKMPMGPFLLYTTIGATLWNSILASFQRPAYGKSAPVHFADLVDTAWAGSYRVWVHYLENDSEKVIWTY